jgi:hypothetical protein
VQLVLLLVLSLSTRSYLAGNLLLSFKCLTMSISGATTTINDGTVTVWYPLSTAFPSNAACSAQIYQYPTPSVAGPLIAFDPAYTIFVGSSSPSCIPTQAAKSWQQALFGSEKTTGTTTLLGPTFVCPGDYSTVATLSVDSLTKHVLCCPTYVHPF